MPAGWLVKLTTKVLGTVEWYFSTEETADAAIAAVKRLPGNAAHLVEAVRPASADESRAIRIEHVEVQ